MRIRHLNGFIILGFMLLLISFLGMVRGNAALTEPGQPVNPYAWAEYLGASVLMLVNGGLSIWNANRRGGDEKPAGTSATETSETTVETKSDAPS